jgi:hypothetical protein
MSVTNTNIPDAQGPTEDQVKLMDAYSKANFDEILANSVKAIESVAADAAKELGDVLGKYVQAFKHMAVQQAEELCVHRKIEQAIMCETMTEDMWQNLAGQLLKLRQSKLELQRAMQESQAEGVVKS